MKESDVILAPLPQDDKELKYRPAIVLREMPIPYRDLLVCGVSTRLDQYIHEFDDIISPTDVDFTSSGLRSKSLIRLNFLAVIPRRIVRGTIGNISNARIWILIPIMFPAMTNEHTPHLLQLTN